MRPISTWRNASEWQGQATKGHQLRNCHAIIIRKMTKDREINRSQKRKAHGSVAKLHPRSLCSSLVYCWYNPRVGTVRAEVMVPRMASKLPGMHGPAVGAPHRWQTCLSKLCFPNGGFLSHGATPKSSKLSHWSKKRPMVLGGSSILRKPQLDPTVVERLW